jgi:hypothetical protein
VFDINVLGSCAHITKRNVKDFARTVVKGVDKLVHILAQEDVRVTGRIIIPRKQARKIREVIKEIRNLMQEIVDPTKSELLGRLISAQEITGKIKCCKEVAERDEEYGDICNAFKRCRGEDLAAITCLGEIFSEREAFDVLKNKLRCNCELRLYDNKKTAGSSRIYIIHCYSH